MSKPKEGDEVVAAEKTAEDVRPRGTRPGSYLSPQEVLDLQFVFDGAEGAFGVRSSQGALEDELRRRCPSDAEMHLRTVRNQQRAQRRRKPRRTPLAAAFDRTLYKIFDLRSPTYCEWEDELPNWATHEMQGHETKFYATNSDGIDLAEAGRASHTRHRLVLVGSAWASVLYAAYGPRAAQWGKESRGNADHPVTKLGGQHLGEIALTILHHECFLQDDEHSWTRAMLWSVAANPERMRKLREDSRSLLDRACRSYRITRCPRPCRRCWPT